MAHGFRHYRESVRWAVRRLRRRVGAPSRAPLRRPSVLAEAGTANGKGFACRGDRAGRHHVRGCNASCTATNRLYHRRTTLGMGWDGGADRGDGVRMPGRAPIRPWAPMLRGKSRAAPAQTPPGAGLSRPLPHVVSLPLTPHALLEIQILERLRQKGVRYAQPNVKMRAIPSNDVTKTIRRGDNE